MKLPEIGKRNTAYVCFEPLDRGGRVKAEIGGFVFEGRTMVYVNLVFFD